MTGTNHPCHLFSQSSESALSAPSGRLCQRERQDDFAPPSGCPFLKHGSALAPLELVASLKHFPTLAPPLGELSVQLIERALPRCFRHIFNKHSVPLNRIADRHMYEERMLTSLQAHICRFLLLVHNCINKSCRQWLLGCECLERLLYHP